MKSDLFFPPVLPSPLFPSFSVFLRNLALARTTRKHSAPPPSGVSSRESVVLAVIPFFFPPSRFFLDPNYRLIAVAHLPADHPDFLPVRSRAVINTILNNAIAKEQPRAVFLRPLFPMMRAVLRESDVDRLCDFLSAGILEFINVKHTEFIFPM